MSADKKISFEIKATHPCLAGHFPGNPVVPGVVILDEVVQVILQQFSGYKVVGFSRVKFLVPLLAEQEVVVQVGERVGMSNEISKIKFTSICNNVLIAQGELKLEKLS